LPSEVVEELWTVKEYVDPSITEKEKEKKERLLSI